WFYLPNMLFKVLCKSSTLSLKLGIKYGCAYCLDVPNSTYSEYSTSVPISADVEPPVPLISVSIDFLKSPVSTGTVSFASLSILYAVSVISLPTSLITPALHCSSDICHSSSPSHLTFLLI